MIAICNVCESALSVSLYESLGTASITTMNQMIEGTTEVRFCSHCGHVQTSELPSLVEYYANEYEINATSDEEDQLYKVVDGRKVYRAEHQASVLMSKISFRDGLRVLDYGCAKSATLKKVLTRHSGIKPFLFDVTDRYVPFWERFPQDVQWSTHTPNPDWFGTMDVVLSFYALEHVSDLTQALLNVKRLLKTGGIFYFLVPNMYHNVADFVVADHVNHFSASSLAYLLQRHGFGEIEVDEQIHDAAFVVKARFIGEGAGMDTPDGDALARLREEALHIAQYWNTFAARVKEYEGMVGDGAMAIYGAGFYGNFISTLLMFPERISCFVDQNEYLRGKRIMSKPIVAPQDIPDEVSHVLVGLNPAIAKSVIGQIEQWQGKSLEFFYL